MEEKLCDTNVARSSTLAGPTAPAPMRGAVVNPIVGHRVLPVA